MPFRNAAAHLDEAVASVLAQESVDLELLAIDDGSTDESAAILGRLARGDARVKPIASDGRGIAAALTTGLAAATGELIARMDADDVCAPSRLLRQRDVLHAALASGDRIGALGVRVRGFPDDAVEGGLRAYIDWQNALVTPEDHARDLFVEAPLCHPSVMMPRAALEAVGGFREMPWAEDYDLWLRLDAAGFVLAKLPEVLFSWRHHGGRATFTNPVYARARFAEAKAHYLAPRLRAMNLPIVVWGAGKTGRVFARALEAHGIAATGFIDIDPRKIGRTAREAPISAPESLVRGAYTVLVALGARGARATVRGRLAGMGFVEGADFICVS